MLALVTGGNRGIGYAACRGLAERGIKVLLGARDKKLGEIAAQTLRDEQLDVYSVVIDVSDLESIENAKVEITKEFGPIDILVNNAGVIDQGNLLEIKEEDLIKNLQINLMGPIHCIRTFAPDMVNKGYGRIVNVSSGWGSFAEGLGGPAPYSISKAGLNAVTVTGSHALPKEVKINSMCPGWVHTRMGGENAPRSEEEGADTIIWLATLSEDGPTGKFFRDRTEIKW